MAGYRTCSHYYLDSLECLECLECSEFLECLEDEEPTSGQQRERERFGESGSATTKVFPFILFLIYSHYSPCPFGALMGTLSCVVPG